MGSGKLCVFVFHIGASKSETSLRLWILLNVCEVRSRLYRRWIPQPVRMSNVWMRPIHSVRTFKKLGSRTAAYASWSDEPEE